LAHVLKSLSFYQREGQAIVHRASAKPDADRAELEQQIEEEEHVQAPSSKGKDPDFEGDRIAPVDRSPVKTRSISRRPARQNEPNEASDQEDDTE
jgi:hypothetical protein